VTRKPGTAEGDAETLYNNRAAVPDHPAVMARWKASAEAVRAETPPVRLAYGARARETIDLFEAGPGAPVVVFIHGGYWQALDPSWFSGIVPAFRAHGVGVAIPAYDLCPEVPLATIVDWYPGVLIALFVIASGVTLLQVAANPLVAALGSKKSSHARLNFSQFFNSLGATIGPFLGSTILLTGGVFAAGAVVTEATRAESLRAIDFAFLAMAGFFVLMALFIFTARKKIDVAAAGSNVESASPLKAFSSKWAIFGALAIFLYVGSEVTIGIFMTDFLHSSNILDIPLEDAGRMVSLYWGGAMVGRLIGSALMTRVPAGILLAICTAVAATLCAVVTQTGGTTAAYAAIGVGLFNSIMFPTIFTLACEGLGRRTAEGSGVICVAIVGGAIVPLLMGFAADAVGLKMALAVPAVCYAVIVYFGLYARRPHRP